MREPLAAVPPATTAARPRWRPPALREPIAAPPPEAVLRLGYVGVALGALLLAAGLVGVAVTAGRAGWGVALLAAGWVVSATAFGAVRRAEREAPFGARALHPVRRGRAARARRRGWPPPLGA